MELQPVKAIDLDAGLIEGLAIPFGGPMEGRDLVGERFTKGTNFYLGLVLYPAIALSAWI